jgi:chloramphenicol 3-O phosphotransferase
VIDDALVVLMSGPSSAGKTTTARALQRTHPDVWLFVDVDLFNGMRPPDRNLTEEELARQLSGNHRAIAGMASCGQRLIVEHRVVKAEWLDDLREVLGELPLLVVKFECSLGALEARERGRGDRPDGAARKTFAEPPYKYDLLIDSSRTAPLERAQAIAELVEHRSR